MTGVWVVAARAGRVNVDDRAALAERWRDQPGVLLETCHRVELYGCGPVPDAVAGELPHGTRVLHDEGAAGHAVDVALGLDSVVVAEDQILFQLRTALDAARRRGGLSGSLDRLLDGALRAGRRGRSWLPARRPSLADLALASVPNDLDGSNVLVVGAGRMGVLAARSAVAGGAIVTIASRTAERAVAAAERLGIAATAFDPGAALDNYSAVVVALSGAWNLSPIGMATLAGGRGHLVDLSSPPAVPAALRLALEDRFHSVDDLADPSSTAPRDALVLRLRGLAAATVAEYLEWAARQSHRDTAREVAARAEQIRGGELADLWRRVPSMPPEQRAEIEQMTERLAARLLREPLERLGRDADGTSERAARELFGL